MAPSSRRGDEPPIPADAVPAFLDRAMAGDEAAVGAALAEHPGLARARDEAGVSVVCLAVYRGRPQTAALIAAGRDDLDIFESAVLGDCGRASELLAGAPDLASAFSPDGFQPLGYACFFGHPALVDLLIEAGAPVDEPARNASGVRPIHSAAAQRDPGLALRIAGRLLAAGASANVAQQGGYTPLHQAAHSGHAGLADLLIAHRADRRARAADGQTPAEMARAAGHESLAARLEP